MKKKSLFFGLFLLFVSAMLMTGMSNDGCGCQATEGVYQKDIKLNLSKEGWTAEQLNIKRRAELSDPQKIWWIYCLADNGQVVFYGDVKGKVTSSGKRIAGIDSEGIDVSGESALYVYWFNAQGQYFQWDGKYFLTSSEIRISEPVLNFRGVK